MMTSEDKKLDCVDLTSKRKFKWTEQIQEVLNISSSDSDVHLVKIIQPVSIVSSKRKRLHKKVHDTPMNTSNSSDLPVVDLKSQKHQLDLILKASNAIKSLHEISKKKLESIDQSHHIHSVNSYQNTPKSAKSNLLTSIRSNGLQTLPVDDNDTKSISHTSPFKRSLPVSQFKINIGKSDADHTRKNISTTLPIQTLGSSRSVTEWKSNISISADSKDRRQVEEQPNIHDECSVSITDSPSLTSDSLDDDPHHSIDDIPPLSTEINPIPKDTRTKKAFNFSQWRASVASNSSLKNLNHLIEERQKSKSSLTNYLIDSNEESNDHVESETDSLICAKALFETTQSSPPDPTNYYPKLSPKRPTAKKPLNSFSRLSDYLLQNSPSKKIINQVPAQVPANIEPDPLLLPKEMARVYDSQHSKVINQSAKVFGAESTTKKTNDIEMESEFMEMPMEAGFQLRWEKFGSSHRNEYFGRQVYHSLTSGAWHGVPSLMMERLQGHGLSQTKLKQPIALVSSRGKTLEIDRPKRSFLQLLQLRETGCPNQSLSRNTFEQITTHRQESQWRRVFSYKRGSGEANVLQFFPNALKIASMHIAKTDTYNESGNFLVCNLDDESWSDGHKHCVRQMTDATFENHTEGFSHTFRGTDGVGNRNTTNNYLERNASGIDLAITDDGETICTVAHNDSTLKVWNMSEPSKPKSYSVCDGRLAKFRKKHYKHTGNSSITLDRKTNLTATGSYDGGVYLLNLNANDTLNDPVHILRMADEMMERNFRSVTTVMFGKGPTKNTIFAGYEQPYDFNAPGVIRQWGMYHNRIPKATFSLGANAPAALSISKDGTVFVI
ncbi:hypothetical protein BC833DRAFT_596886 [Globomyces pollinis-pini]|nr:hypothetical protein BC833DRAFT_596886 [Globomyces pollinis-pini]